MEMRGGTQNEQSIDTEGGGKWNDIFIASGRWQMQSLVTLSTGCICYFSL